MAKFFTLSGNDGNADIPFSPAFSGIADLLAFLFRRINIFLCYARIVIAELISPKACISYAEVQAKHTFEQIARFTRQCSSTICWEKSEAKNPAVE